jgi:predicted benzoate:H+ symporter BenE
MSRTTPGGGTSHAVVAGVVTALVGFTSSFAVLLTGLTAVGASPRQAASGLAVLSVTMGLGCVVLSLHHRIPVTMAWSTPGAALLAGAAVPTAGGPALGRPGHPRGATSALAQPRHREAGAVTFLVAASGLSFAGVGPAFWALVVGGLVLVVTGAGRASSG